MHLPYLVQYYLLLSGIICTLVVATALPSGGRESTLDPQPQMEKEEGAPTEGEAHQVSRPGYSSSLDIMPESELEAPENKELRKPIKQTRPLKPTAMDKFVPTSKEREAVVEEIRAANEKAFKTRNSFSNHLKYIHHLKRTYGVPVLSISRLLKMTQDDSRSPSS